QHRDDANMHDSGPAARYWETPAFSTVPSGSRSMRRNDSLFSRNLPVGNGPATIAAGQRARMLDAITRVVVRKGYAHTTVADVVEVAGVSRRTFYEQVADKEACFLAAYETAAGAVLADIAGAVRALPPAATWRERLHRALETYVR